MLRQVVHLPILAVQFAVVGSRGWAVEPRCQMPSGNPAWNAALPEGMAVQATVAAYGTVRPTSLPHSFPVRVPAVLKETQACPRLP